MACLCVSFSACSSSECFCCKRSSNSYEIKIDKIYSIPAQGIYEVLNNKQLATKSRQWHTLEIIKNALILLIFSSITKLSYYYIFSFQWLIVIKITCAQKCCSAHSWKREKTPIYGYIYNSKQCDKVQIHRWVQRAHNTPLGISAPH